MTLEDILGDIPKEGTDPFEGMVKETPAESPTAKEPEADKSTVDDNTPEGESMNAALLTDSVFTSWRRLILSIINTF